MITLELGGIPYEVHRCLALSILLQTTEDLAIVIDGNSCKTQAALRNHAHREAHLFAFRKRGTWQEAREHICKVAGVSLKKFERECVTRTTKKIIKEVLE